MRTSKVIAFSVPPEMEHAIEKHAKHEQRTISEYLREAVRHYMAQSEFENTIKNIRKKVKAKGVRASDVERIIQELRKR